MTGPIGSVGVAVVPDATDFWRRFRAETEGNQPDLSVRVRADITEAEARLTELKAQIARTSGDVNVRADTKQAQQQMHLLRDAIILLGPAAIPIAGVLTGAMAGLVPITAAVGLGILGIRDALKSGGLEGTIFAHNVDLLKVGFDQLKQTAAQGLIPGLNSAIHTLGAELPTITPMIHTFAVQIGNIAGNVAPVLLRSFVQLNPLFTEFGNLTLRGAQALNHWSASSGGLSNFVAYAQAELPTVLHALGELVTTVGHLVSGLAPLGHTSLIGITLLSQAINAIPTSTLQALLPVLVGVYAATRTYALLTPIINGVSAAYGFFAARAAASSLAVEASTAAEAAAVATASAEEAQARATLAGEIAAAQAQIAESLAGTGSALEAEATVAAEASAEEAAAFQAAADAAAAAAAEITAAAEEVAAASTQAGAEASVGWASVLGPVAALAVGVGLLAVVIGTSSNKTQEAAKAAASYAQSVRDSTNALSTANIVQTNDNLAKNGALDLYDKISTAALKLGLNQIDLTTAVNGSDTQFRKVTDTLDTYLSQIRDQRETGKLSSDLVDQAHAAQDLKDKLTTLRDGLHQQIVTQEQLNAVNEASLGLTSQQTLSAAALYGLHGTTGVAAYLAAKQATDKNTTSTNAQTLAFQLENNAAGLVNLALQTMAGQHLSNAQAQTALDQATLSLTASLKTNGNTIADNTDKGVANRQAIEGAASALRSKLTAESEATHSTVKATAEYRTNAAAILDQIAKTDGVTSATYKYAQQLFALPPVKKTKLELEQAKAAADLAAYKAELATLARDIYINLHVTGTGSLGTLANEAHTAHGGTIGGYAGGGTVNGPGGPHSDSIVVPGPNRNWALSNGEEVIQNPYAGEHRALLKAINNGQDPARFLSVGPKRLANGNTSGKAAPTQKIDNWTINEATDASAVAYEVHRRQWMAATV